MEGGKKVAVVVVVVVIIVVASILVLKKGLHVGAPTPPAWVLQQPQEKIDQKSLKLITKTMGEWESLGEKNGKYKNPEMGEYTMMVPMVCQTCGEKIPLPEIAAPRPGEAPGAGGDPHAQRRSYKCPKCGKPAFI